MREELLKSYLKLVEEALESSLTVLENYGILLADLTINDIEQEAILVDIINEAHRRVKIMELAVGYIEQTINGVESNDEVINNYYNIATRIVIEYEFGTNLNILKYDEARG